VNEELEPIVGNWYRREDNDEIFTVIAVDEDEGLIEIQLLDGEVEEIDEATWSEMELELVDEPDEWRGELDNMDDEDFDYDEDEDEDDDWGDYDDRD